MKNIAKLCRLPSAERRVLLQALALVVTIRLALWGRQYPALRRITAQIAHRANLRRPTVAPATIAWAVGVASSYVPAATCLTQALAAHVLLARQGYVSRVRIGVAKNTAGQIDAHAWVESAGQIVIGGSARSIQRYTLLPLDEGGAA